MSYYTTQPCEHALDDQDFNHAKDHLIGLVEDIYKTGSIEDLEYHLEEILLTFGLKIPSTQPQIMKKPTAQQVETDRMLRSWVGYTRAYSEMMTTTKR